MAGICAVDDGTIRNFLSGNLSPGCPIWSGCAPARGSPEAGHARPSHSAIALYSAATSVVLDPMRKTTRSLILMGPLERISLSRFESPLPLGQSALVVAPHLVLLVAITLVCFGLCYACFMRQEVRTT